MISTYSTTEVNTCMGLVATIRWSMLHLQQCYSFVAFVLYSSILFWDKIEICHRDFGLQPPGWLSLRFAFAITHHVSRRLEFLLILFIQTSCHTIPQCITPIQKHTSTLQDNENYHCFIYETILYTLTLQTCLRVYFLPLYIITWEVIIVKNGNFYLNYFYKD